MPKRDLSGKVVMVTGAGSGLGRAMAIALANSGAKVAGVDVNIKGMQETANLLSGEFTPVKADITSVADSENAIATTIKDQGDLHVLINCAGLGMPTLRVDYWNNSLYFWEADPDKWQRLMDVNVRGAFLMARAATPHFLEQKWGRLVNVTTSMNTMIRGGNMPYGQSKASLEAASNAWADDLTDTGVTCNVLVPGGAADTPMVPQESPYERQNLVQPEVMGPPACWLASNDSDGTNSMRFLARNWDPAATDTDNIKNSGSPAAWPDLADAAAVGQPATVHGKDIPR